MDIWSSGLRGMLFILNLLNMMLAVGLSMYFYYVKECSAHSVESCFFFFKSYMGSLNFVRFFCPMEMIIWFSLVMGKMCITLIDL